jgi:outer membrane murein-binding lipoprotein Lpp
MRYFGCMLAMCSLGLSACSAAPLPQARTSSILPLRTLRLYETGVGYFERAGAMHSTEDTSLPVPAGHIDDALKTLVVLSSGGKSSVQGLEFGSIVSNGMARALAGLPIGSEAPISYRDILSSLKGASVEVQSNTEKVTGRIIDVLDSPDPPKASHEEPKSTAPAPPDREAGELIVLVLTSHSEIRRFRTGDIKSVRPTDAAFASRLGAALDALSTHGSRARRFLRVHADSQTPVTLGYVAETPIWRTSYRLVLESGGKRGVIQGWALIHNDTDEDWSRVNMQLVSGRPDSFLFPLAAPRYRKRELVHPDDQLSTVPQLIDKTVDSMWGDQIGDSHGAGGLGLSGIGEGGGGRGEGIGLGSIGTMGHGAGTGSYGSSAELSVGNLATIAQANGLESGALFSYTLAAPLDLRAHGSTLVPFLQRPVEVRVMSLFSASGETARSAVRFVNTTNQTLPAGPIAFFSDGGFAGEAGLDRLKPGERRFMQYGTDQDVTLDVAHAEAKEEVRRLTFKYGMLDEHFMRWSDRSYDIENRSGQERVLYLSLDLVNNAKVTGADEMDYDTQSKRPFAVFIVAGRQKLTRGLKAEEGMSRTHALASLTSELLVRLSTVSTIPELQRKVVAEAALRQKELQDAQAGVMKLKAEMAAVEKDMERLREHLKAAGGDKAQGQAQAINPFVQRILAADDKLTASRKRIEAAEADIKLRSTAVQVVLEKLKFEESPAR